jgi:hypothetical protein
VLLLTQNASQESQEKSSLSPTPSHLAAYSTSTYPQTIRSPLSIVSTSTPPSIITSATLHKFYLNLPHLACPPDFLPTYPLFAYSMSLSIDLSTSFVNLPLVFENVNRGRFEMTHNVYVVESEEGIVLSVGFWRKEGQRD